MTQPMRRVAGYHDIRLDGITDLVIRARGASVFDVGCNRGLVGFEMANNGATVVHGCDIDAECINVCRHIFADLRAVKSRFEVVDLTGGAEALKAAFHDELYDIVLCLATYHKLKRTMPAPSLTELMRHIGKRTKTYFGWRGTSKDSIANEGEIAALDRDLGSVGLKRVHTSHLSEELGAACIWKRDA